MYYPRSSLGYFELLPYRPHILKKPTCNNLLTMGTVVPVCNNTVYGIKMQKQHKKPSQKIKFPKKPQLIPPPTLTYIGKCTYIDCCISIEIEKYIL